MVEVSPVPSVSPPPVAGSSSVPAGLRRERGMGQRRRTPRHQSSGQRDGAVSRPRANRLSAGRGAPAVLARVKALTATPAAALRPSKSASAHCWARASATCATRPASTAGHRCSGGRRMATDHAPHAGVSLMVKMARPAETTSLWLDGVFHAAAALYVNQPRERSGLTLEGSGAGFSRRRPTRTARRAVRQRRCRPRAHRRAVPRRRARARWPQVPVATGQARRWPSGNAHRALRPDQGHERSRRTPQQSDRPSASKLCKTNDSITRS